LCGLTSTAKGLALVSAFFNRGMTRRQRVVRNLRRVIAEWLFPAFLRYWYSSYPMTGRHMSFPEIGLFGSIHIPFVVLP